MPQLGADPDALRELGAAMRSGSRQLDDIALQLERRVRTAGWRGADAERFLRQWHGHRGDLRRVGDRCRRLAAAVDRQASEQIVASGLSGGSSNPHPPPAATPKPPEFPTSEDRYHGGLDLRVGPATVSVLGDVTLQRLRGDRTRIVVARTAGIGGALSAGATAQASVSDEIAAPVPAGGLVADGRVRVGGVVRQSWEVDDAEVGPTLARIAAQQVGDQIAGDVDVISIAGGWIDAAVEGVTGVDLDVGGQIDSLLTPPEPDRVETLAEVEVGGLLGAALGGRGVLGGAANATATVRFGQSAGDGGRSQIIELSGGGAATASSSMLGRLGLTLPGGWRTHGTTRLELFDDIGDTRTLNVRFSGIEGSTLNDVVARVDLSGAAYEDTVQRLRLAAVQLAQGRTDQALAALGALEVPIDRVTVATSSGEITGTTARVGASAAAGIGAGVTARGQVLHVDRVS